MNDTDRKIHLNEETAVGLICSMREKALDLQNTWIFTTGEKTGDLQKELDEKIREVRNFLMKNSFGSVSDGKDWKTFILPLPEEMEMKVSIYKKRDTLLKLEFYDRMIVEQYEEGWFDVLVSKIDFQWSY